MSINLSSSIWYCGSDERFNEIIDTVVKNINLNYIDNYYLFFSDDVSKNKLTSIIDLDILCRLSGSKTKIKFINVSEKITYQYIINFINENCDHNDINIIANSDIIFDGTLSRIFSWLTHEDFYCITRHELDKTLFWVRNNLMNEYYSGSQDVWIWRGKCKIKTANFSPGVPKCDHYFAFKAYEAKYVLSNPCLSLIVTHNHKSNIRNGTSAIAHDIEYSDMPFVFLKPKYLPYLEDNVSSDLLLIERKTINAIKNEEKK